MEKKNLGILYVLIAAIVILFTAMLVLCGMYLDLRLNGVTSSLPHIPENDKWILTDNSYNSHNSSGNLIAPVFLGLKNNASGMMAATYNEDARETLGNMFEAEMTALFNGYAEKMLFENDEHKKEFAKKIMASESFMYMCFYNELPSAAILPGIYGSGSYMPLNESFYVKCVFILPDGDSIKGVCFDSELNACVLSPGNKTEYNQSALYAYNEVSGFAAFEFLNESCPEPVFTQSFEINSVVMAPSFSFYKFNLNDNNTTELLKALDFNTNLVKTYTYSTNSIVSFVGEEKELYVSYSDRSLHYNGFDGGIHMSEYLKYYPQNGEYTFTDTVLCVRYLLNCIDRILIGGDAKPSVVGIFYENNDVIFRLKYFYNGIAITESNADITVVMDGKYIKRIDINTMFCDSGNLTVPVIPQKLALNLFDDEKLDDGFSGLGAVLENNANGGTTELVWIVRKEGA